MIAQSPHAPAKPPAEFLEAAQKVALTLCEDIDKLIAGTTVTYKGISFSLHHYAPVDMAGMVLAMDIGPLSAQSEAFSCKAMLRHSLVFSTAAGYYALRSEKDTMVYCTRLDFDKVPDAAEAVLALVNMAVVSREAFGQVLREEVIQLEHKATGHFDRA